MPDINLKGFIIHRFFRLFPTLFVITILHFLIFKEFRSNIGIYTFLTTTTNTFDVFYFAPQTIVYWTLAIELHMYILFAIFYKFRPKIDRIFIYGCVCILFAIYCIANITNSALFISILSRNLSCITLILIGTGFLLKNKIHILTISLLYCIFTMCCTQNGFDIANLDDKYMLIDAQDYGMQYGLMLKRITALIGFTIALKLFTVKSKILLCLSDISYPLYLIHVSVMMKIGISTNAKIIKSILISIVLSYIIHIFIEKRFIQYGKKLANNLSKI